MQGDKLISCGIVFPFWFWLDWMLSGPRLYWARETLNLSLGPVIDQCLTDSCVSVWNDQKVFSRRCQQWAVTHQSHLYCSLFTLSALFCPFTGSHVPRLALHPCVVRMNLNFWSSCFYLLNPVIIEAFHLARILCSAGNQTQDFYLHSQPKAFSQVVVLRKLMQEYHTSKVNPSQTLSLNKTNLLKEF